MKVILTNGAEILRAEVLQKFFKGECTPEQVHEILVWINTPGGEKEFREAFEAFEHGSYAGNVTLDADEVLAKVHDRIKEEKLIKEIISAQQETSLELSTRHRKKSFMFSKLAAAIALVLVSGGAYFYISHHLAQENREVVLKPGILQTKSTEPGQKLTIHLGDGSVAILNASSSITYPKKFTGNTRSVQMQGEVFFEVAHDEKKPFVVSTSKLNTTALGTSFNIRAYDDDHQQISLVTGKVKVVPQDTDLVNYLEPGEEIILRDGALSTAKFDVLTKVLWKEGIIYFDSTPLEECFETLEQWYGVEFLVRGLDPGKTLKVSGRFDNDYLANVLNSISYTHEFDYEIDKERVHITFP